MTRFAILAAAALSAGAAVGCSENGKPATPAEMKQGAGASTASASAAAQPNYFEVLQDGKTYVLSRTESMVAVNQGQSANVKPVALDNGDTIYVEQVSFTDANRLVAAYKKNHGM